MVTFLDTVQTNCVSRELMCVYVQCLTFTDREHRYLHLLPISHLLRIFFTVPNGLQVEDFWQFRLLHHLLR